MVVKNYFRNCNRVMFNHATIDWRDVIIRRIDAPSAVFTDLDAFLLLEVSLAASFRDRQTLPQRRQRRADFLLGMARRDVLWAISIKSLQAQNGIIPWITLATGNQQAGSCCYTVGNYHIFTLNRT